MGPIRYKRAKMAMEAGLLFLSTPFWFMTGPAAILLIPLIFFGSIFLFFRALSVSVALDMNREGVCLNTHWRGVNIPWNEFAGVSLGKHTSYLFYIIPVFSVKMLFVQQKLPNGSERTYKINLRHLALSADEIAVLDQDLMKLAANYRGSQPAGAGYTVGANVDQNSKMKIHLQRRDKPTGKGLEVRRGATLEAPQKSIGGFGRKGA